MRQNTVIHTNGFGWLYVRRCTYTFESDHTIHIENTKRQSDRWTNTEKYTTQRNTKTKNYMNC